MDNFRDNRADERAREIANNIYYAWSGDNDADMIEAITAALVEFGETEVMKWRENHKEKWATWAIDKAIKADAEGYRRGVEEAAKEADWYGKKCGQEGGKCLCGSPLNHVHGCPAYISYRPTQAGESK